MNSAGLSCWWVPNVYLRVGEADFAVAPYTEDADLALIPELLLDLPVLAEALAAANFTSDQPGIWTGASGGTVDLLVPEALGGSGRRGARLGPPHGDKVARKVKGLEGALVDQKNELISALGEGDRRAFELAVAGSGALLTAKLHKIADRSASGKLHRLDAKDALDVLRLLRGSETEPLAATLADLTEDPRASEITQASLEYLAKLFGAEDAVGTRLAVRATAGLEDPDTIAASCVALTSDLLAALKKRS